MNKHHQQLLEEIKKEAGNGTQHSWSDSYLGSGHFYYSLKNSLKRQIAKTWTKEHQAINTVELLELLSNLYQAESYEEKTLASYLLEYLPKQRTAIKPQYLDQWLDHLQGWAEIDTLCQGIFSAQEMLANWSTWQKLLLKFNQAANISKRRASLVLLTNPVSNSKESALADLAFANIDRLKLEKNILLTKAISWLLRSLSKHHRAQVAIYLEENKTSLPTIAIRETTNKLMKGKK